MPTSSARTKKHRRQNGQKALTQSDSLSTSLAARGAQILLFLGCIVLVRGVREGALLR